MTDSGRADDAFAQDDELLNDDEFVLDLGDEVEANSDSWQAQEGTTEGEVLQALGAGEGHTLDEGMDLEFDEAAEVAATDGGESPELDPGDELLDLSAPDSYVLVDSSSVERAPGQADIDSDDLLFSDERDGISTESEFGADLGPNFSADNAFEMGDHEFHEAVGAEASDSTASGERGGHGDEAFEVDIGPDEDDADVPELDAEWDTAATAEQSFEGELASESSSDSATAGFDDSDWETEDGPAPDMDADAVGGPQGDLWEDVSLGESGPAEDHDPIYGEEGVETAGDAYAYPDDGGPDYAEHEVAYADATTASDVGQVVGSVHSRRSLRWVAGLAALIPLVAAGVIAFAKPEWVERILGNTPSDTTVAIGDRTNVARPVANLGRVKPPKVTFAGAVEVGPNPGDGTSGGETQVSDNPPVTPPIRVDPNENPTGQGGDPDRMPDVAIDRFPETDPNPTTAIPGDPSSGTDAQSGRLASEFYAVGDDLLIARMPAVADLGSVHPVAAGLRPGSQAFARLANGARFSGSIRRLEATTITLALEAGGEVTFHYDDVIDLMPLASAALDDISDGQHRRGYVRLTNNARLFGSLHRDGATGTVTLVERDSVVAVPAGQILRFGYEASAGVEIVQDANDDDWLRQRVRRKIDER